MRCARVILPCARAMASPNARANAPPPSKGEGRITVSAAIDIEPLCESLSCRGAHARPGRSTLAAPGRWPGSCRSVPARHAWPCECTSSECIYWRRGACASLLQRYVAAVHVHGERTSSGTRGRSLGRRPLCQEAPADCGRYGLQVSLKRHGNVAPRAAKRAHESSTITDRQTALLTP